MEKKQILGYEHTNSSIFSAFYNREERIYQPKNRVSRDSKYIPAIPNTLKDENIHGIRFSDMAKIAQIHQIKY